MVESLSLAAIVIISSLLFGSVETWSFALVGILTLVLFNVWFIQGLRNGTRMVYFEKNMLIAVLAFVCFVLVQIIPLPPVLLGLLASKKSSFLGMLSLSGFNSISIYPYATVNALMKLILYILLFTLSAFLAVDRAESWHFLKIIVFFGFLLSLFAIIQNATWNGKIFWFRELTKGGSPFGPFVNRNHFAGFIGMIIPFGLALGLRSRDREKKFLYIFVSVIMGLGLFYSLSRGGIISFIVSTFFFVVFVIVRKYSSGSRIVIGIFISLLASYLLYFGMSPILDRFASADVSMGHRAFIWEAMLGAAKDFFLMGSGLGTFPYMSPMYHPGEVTAFFDHAHNDYIEFLTDTGIIGVVLFVAFFIAYVRDVMGSRWWKRRHYHMILAGISSIIYIAVHSIVDFNLHIPSNALLLAVVMGLVYGRAMGMRIHSEGEGIT